MNRTAIIQRQGKIVLSQNLPGFRSLGRAIYYVFLLLILGSCVVVGPDYQQPEAQTQKNWHAELQGGLTAETSTAVSTANWWTAFQDPQLESLLDRAVKGSLDLREAQARIQESRALRGLARADFYPSLDGSAAAGRSADSKNSSTGGERDLFSAGFDASWELDIFGGVTRAVEAAQSGLEASQEDFRDLLVSLQAEIALNYAELRTYQTRLAVSRTNIAGLQESYELNNSRRQAGVIGELPVQESLRLLESSRTLVPALETELEAVKNRLAVLLGEQPGQLHDELAAAVSLPDLPPSVAVGIPAETLRRRPDVRRAERRLAAQSARIGVATADLYPKFRLTGSLGLEALAAGELLQSASSRWGFGPSVRWNLFDAGAVRRNIEVQNARQEQSLVQYERTILRALEEVENALVAYAKEQLRRDSIRKAATAAERTEELARDQYRAGLISFNNVLDAQRSLLVLRDELARSDGATFANLVRLYKALGGGWQSMPRETEASG